MDSRFVVSVETKSLKTLPALWRPFMILMKTSGLMFINEPPWNPLKLYSLVMVIFSWCVFLFHFYELLFYVYNGTFDVSVRSMKLLTNDAYVIQGALKCLVLFLVFHRPGCMQRIFEMWSTVRFPTDISHRLELSVNVTAKVAVAAALTTYAVSEIFEISTYLAQGLEMKFLALYSVLASIDVVSSVFCWVMVATTTALFSAVNECFVRRNLNSRIPLEDMCSTFYTAVDIVSTADGSLNIVFGCQLLSNLLQCCFNTYIVFFDPFDTALSLTISIFWDFLAFGMFWFVFWGAANVNTEAHRLLKHIHHFPLKNARSSEMVQLLVLHNHLSTYSIGFSMFGVQIITRGALPVFLSCFATYLFLLAQFHLGNRTAQCDCYCFQNDTHQ